MRALITRPQEDAETLVAELHAAGVETFIEPLLNIVSIPDAVARLDNIQAILLTSRNGARALAEVTDRRDVPIYAVGDATALTARDLGFSQVDSASGNSAALAQLVTDRLDPQDGALLHGSGTAVAGDLAGTLAAKGFTVHCETLYEARPAERLSAELQAQLTDGRLDMATFFSPRTAQSFVNLLTSAGLASACRAVTAICISPAVARALGSMVFHDVRVASRPDGASMIAAVSEARELLEAASEDPAADIAETVTEPEPEPETAIETSVTPEDDQTDSDDQPEGAGGQSPWDAPEDSSESSPENPPEKPAETKRSGGRAGTWFLLIALVVVGIGFATYPKWKSYVPADWLPGSEIASTPSPASPSAANVPAKPDNSAAAIVGLKEQIRRLRGDTAGAISNIAKKIKTYEIQLAATEAQLAIMEAQLAATEAQFGAVGKELAAIQEALKNAAPATGADPDTGAAPAAGSAKAALELTVINQRIDSLKKQIEDGKSALAQARAAGAEKPVTPSAAEQTLTAENQRLSAALQTLTARIEAIDGQQAARNTRLAAIEAATKQATDAAMEAAASRAANAGTGSRGNALIVAVGQLRDALTRSAPFTAHLQSLSTVAAGNAEITQAVAPLAPFAKTGVPTRALLKQRFNDVAALVARVALVSRDTGWLDQTLSRLSSVVTVRRVGDDVTGDTAQAILARAEARIGADDLVGATVELGKLTGAAAKSAAKWREDAQARLTADTSIAALTRMVIHNLAAPDGANKP